MINLSAGALRLVINPDVGGSILSFERQQDGSSTPILRPPSGSADQVLDAASFPLVPYVNRIRDGRFAFRGGEVQLAPNMAGDRSPLHGQGWLHSWQVVRQSDAKAELLFRHDAGEWPWTYEARQRFALDDHGLTLVLSCTNRSDDPMPCGLGQHPYFPCTAETVLDAEVETAWTVDADVLPVDRVAAEGCFDLKARTICGQDLDNGFGGWGGQARMSDPSWPFELLLSSPTARFFQVYSPRTGGFFVAEPVTHANAALNAPEEEWAELGLEVLEPGAAMELAMRLDVLSQ